MEYNFGLVETVGEHIGVNLDFLEYKCIEIIMEYNLNVRLGQWKKMLDMLISEIKILLTRYYHKFENYDQFIKLNYLFIYILLESLIYKI